MSKQYTPYRIVSIGLLILIFSLIISDLFSLLPYMPSPDDEIFYIDGAWHLFHGEYPEVSRNFPFHHFLRWSVLFFPGVLFKFLGATDLSYALLPLLGQLMSAGAIYVCLRRSGFEGIQSLWGSLAAFIPSIVVWRYLSEPWVIFWTFTSMIFVAKGKLGGPRDLLLAGLAYGLAINASLVALFSAFIPVVFYLTIYRSQDIASQRFDIWKLFSATMYYLIGVSIIYGVILLGEWCVFGDPLLQFRVILQWHIKSLPSNRNLGSFFFDWQNQSVFIFGFLLRLLKNPLFLVSVFYSVFSLWRSSTSSQVKALLLAGVVSLLGLELFGPLAIDKSYARFASLPYVLIVSSAFTQIPTKFLRWNGLNLFFGLSSVFLVFWSLVSHKTWNAPPSCDAAYGYPLRRILLDSEELHKTRPELTKRKLINFHGDVVAMNHFVHVVSSYTFFKFNSQDVLDEWPLSVEHANTMYYVIVKPGASDPVPPNGFLEQLQYASSCERERARVYRWVTTNHD